MRLSRFFIVVLCMVAVSGLVYAGIETGVDPLSKLLEGNRRFISGEISQKDIGDKRRQELTKGQHPFATVLSCSYSRVGPEAIFDQGLRYVFVIRGAGNVAESSNRIWRYSSVRCLSYWVMNRAAQ